MLPFADLPNREELLQVYAATSAGRRRIHSVEFTSNGPGKVKFGEGPIGNGEKSEWGYMEPIRLVWEKRKSALPTTGSRAV